MYIIVSFIGLGNRFNQMKILSGVLILLLLSIASIQCGKLTSSNQSNSDLPSNPSPVFTHHLTNLNNIKGIVPLGAVSDNTIAEKTYFFCKYDANGNPIKVPLYAPVDMKLVSMAYRISQNQDQYLLFFQVSKEVKIRLDHIDSPIQQIKDVGPSSPAPKDDTKTSKPKKELTFKAGDLIGYTNGTNVGVWDFGVSNTTIENQFVNMDRYRNSKIDFEELHADCPYNYFADSLRSQYEALFALQTGVPYKGATCRSASRDVKGALSGAWYLDKDPYGDFREVLAIAADFNGEIRIAGLGNNDLIVSPNPSPATNPDDVKVNDEICYEGSGGGNFAYFKVLSNTQVNVAYGTGGCPASFPKTNTQIYVR